MPGFLRNKYFVWVVIIAFSVFALSVKTARADFPQLVEFFTSFVFQFIIALVISIICLPCAAVYSIVQTVKGLFAFAYEMITGQPLPGFFSIAGTPLCLEQGITFAICLPGQTPDIYYIGTPGPPSFEFPPPTMAASSTIVNRNCSVSLSWSVLNITYYGIYRATGDASSTLLYQSDACIPQSGTSTPFVINYTDTSTTPATTYTYNLVVEDIDAQLFKFPDQVVKTPSTCTP